MLISSAIIFFPFFFPRCFAWRSSLLFSVQTKSPVFLVLLLLLLCRFGSSLFCVCVWREGRHHPWPHRSLNRVSAKNKKWKNKLGPGIGATAQNNIFLDYTQRIAETQEEIEEEENPTIRQTQGKERKKERKKVSTTISPSHLTIMAAIIVDWLDTPE